MSHRLLPMAALALAGAVVWSAPAAARDLIIIEGPIKAEDLDCKGCVNARALRGNAVKTNKIDSGARCLGVELA